METRFKRDFGEYVKVHFPEVKPSKETYVLLLFRFFLDNGYVIGKREDCRAYYNNGGQENVLLYDMQVGTEGLIVEKDMASLLKSLINHYNVC